MIAAKVKNQSWTIIDFENNQVIPCVDFVLNINNINNVGTNYQHLNIPQDISASIRINPNINPDAEWVMSWIAGCFSNSLTFSKKKTLALSDNLWSKTVVLCGCHIKSYTNSNSNFFSTIDIEISCDFYEEGNESEIFKQLQRDDLLNKILGIGF